VGFGPARAAKTPTKGHIPGATGRGHGAATARRAYSPL
jgi:hypothetical protein